jgi:hypothetical protein
VTTTKPLLKRDNGWETQILPKWKVAAFEELWFMKEQSRKHARKHIKVGCYLKVTLVYKGLIE